MTALALARISPPTAMEYSNGNQMTKEQDIYRESSLVCALVMGADKTRFGKLVEYPEIVYTQG